MQTNRIALWMGAALLGFAPDMCAGEGAQAAPGLAAKYPKDQGIDKDPKVIFVDDFESAATTVLVKDNLVGDPAAGKVGV